MANSELTKLMIAKSLKQLLETKSFTEISVGDIARQCHIGRNTFYYHFKDKYDVITFIFYTEITPLIGDSMSIEHWGSGMRALCRYLQENRTFYLNVLQFQGQNSLSECLMVFYQNLVQSILVNAGGDRILGPEQIRVIARFYAHGLIGVLLTRAQNGMVSDPEPTVQTLEALLSGEIFDQIIGLQRETPPQSFRDAPKPAPL